MAGEEFPEIDDPLEQGMLSIFGDQEFAPMTIRDEQIVGASYRYMSGYDPQAGCGVELWEFLALVRYEGRLQDVHRLLASWDDDSTCELDLQDGAMLLEDGSIATGEEDARRRLRMALALEAVEQ